jgi:hypothetical protein
MSHWRAMSRWVGAVAGVVVLAVVWWVAWGAHLGRSAHVAGVAAHQINVVADLGDDRAPDCSAVSVSRGEPAPSGALRPTSTACVVVGTADASGILRWYFMARGAGNGSVVAPRPVRVGLSTVTLANDAVVAIASSVTVRCTADPTARFEAFVADGLATAAYLDASGALVAIDCTTSTKPTTN